MESNTADLFVLDKVKSTSSMACHVTWDETTRQCSNDVLQDSVQSSSPLTSSLTELSTEQHGLIEEPMNECEEYANCEVVGTTSNSILNSIDTCRICHDGPSQEAFISPCMCRGSLRLVHQSCLERWLGASNRNNCEICGHTILTECKGQPLLNWLRNPTHLFHRYDLICNIICCLIPTPLALYRVFLFITGAITCYSRTTGLNGKVIGLMIFSFCVISAYLIYCIAVWRHHLGVFRDWQKVNQLVKIINFQIQPTSSVVTVGDLHASLDSLPTCSFVINIRDSTHNRPRPPRIVHNRVHPWSWQELEDRDTFIRDPSTDTDTEYSMIIIADAEPMVVGGTPLAPDTADVMVG